MRSVVWPALRSWKSAKPTALLAMIAFAVGIGSTTAIFAVVNGVMLKPGCAAVAHTLYSVLHWQP